MEVVFPAACATLRANGHDVLEFFVTLQPSTTPQSLLVEACCAAGAACVEAFAGTECVLVALGAAVLDFVDDAVAATDDERADADEADGVGEAAAEVAGEELDVAVAFADCELLLDEGAVVLGEVDELLDVELTVTDDVAALVEPLLSHALKPREVNATSAPTLNDRVMFMVAAFLSSS